MADGTCWNVEIMRDLPGKGKGLFATKDFSECDVIFEEKPLVCAQFLWNTLYKYQACDYCMKALETADENIKRLAQNSSLELSHPECCTVKKEEHVPCSQCGIVYCCAACREAAWNQYHQTLCLGQSSSDVAHPLVRLQEAWRQIHYPPETCSIMLLARMIATVKQAKDKASVLAIFGEFCRASVNEEEDIAHKLLGPQFQRQLDMLRQLATEALYEEELQQWFTPEGFKSMFAMIGTNGQGVGTSPFSVWVKNCENLELAPEEKEKLDDFIDNLYDELDKIAGQFLNSEGSGLYRLQSTCNHSCTPNAEVTFPHNDNTVVVRALRDIKQGEELHISYLDECMLERSRHSRKKALRENYIFTCQCAKCVSQTGDPDVTSEEEEDEEEEEAEMEEDET